jgi:hypothetical protein
VRYEILRPDGTRQTRTVGWTRAPGYLEIADLIRPLIDGGELEHVSVLHNGQRRDMFVDENGHSKELQRNEAATKIYRNNWLTQHPKDEPESLPYIVGTAILFPDEVIWR